MVEDAGARPDLVQVRALLQWVLRWLRTFAQSAKKPSCAQSRVACALPRSCSPATVNAPPASAPLSLRTAIITHRKLPKDWGINGRVRSVSRKIGRRDGYLRSRRSHAEPRPAPIFPPVRSSDGGPAPSSVIVRIGLSPSLTALTAIAPARGAPPVRERSRSQGRRSSRIDDEAKT